MYQTSSELTSRPQTVARAFMILLISLLLFSIIGGGGLIVYMNNIHTSTLQIQATTVAHHLLTTQAQATVTSSPQYTYGRVTRTAPTLSDPLDNQHGSWNTGEVSGGSSCMFTGNAYHVYVSPGVGGLPCMNTESNYANFLFQIQMTVIKGTGGGIIFRADQQGTSYYYNFYLTTRGLYSLYVLKESGSGTMLAFGHTITGQGSLYLLAIMAQGHKIAMFVNKRYITSIDDDSSSSGAIGFVGDKSSMQDSLDIAFSNAQVWKL